MDDLLTPLAKQISDWFPEMEGRVLPVSEAEITRENVPTLPLVMLALVDELGNHSWQGNGRIVIKENFIVEFWLKPNRYRGGEGADTPFWSYYDYHEVRDRLLNGVVEYRSGRGGMLEYTGMEIEAMHHAVILTFKLTHHWEWCADDPCETPNTVGDVCVRIVAAADPFCPPCTVEIEPEKEKC